MSSKTPYLDWILSTPRGSIPSPVLPIMCNDEEQLSVQVGEFVYCTPRTNTPPWTAVEVGFPSVDPRLDNPEWEEYMENPDMPATETIYAFVPVRLVREFIKKHKGEWGPRGCQKGYGMNKHGFEIIQRKKGE